MLRNWKLERIKFCYLWLILSIASLNGNMDRGLVFFWLENFLRVFHFRISSDRFVLFG